LHISIFLNKTSDTLALIAHASHYVFQSFQLVFPFRSVRFFEWMVYTSQWMFHTL
jgi:hypothetical protein